MAVCYYKFKSAKDFDSIVMDGPFISVRTLKEKIFESKRFGRGRDFDLIVTNAQTNKEYLDEAMLIPKNTSVLIRRVPGLPRKAIVAAAQEPKVENPIENAQPEKSNFDSEWDDEFGSDLYSTITETLLPVQSSNPPATNEADDEDSKIKALVNTPALDWDWQRQGRGMGGRGFGMERKTPPEGYVCHRCKVAGHFIQHCPTNGDPKYDIKRMKHPIGIPKSMLMETPDGSYALPSGEVAVLKPNEGVFEKEMEGIPSSSCSSNRCVDVPPELHCPLCKQVMKDAALTSKCCFMSFCDKCIREHIMSKSKCVCGATNILADDLVLNKTLRDTINRILESAGNSSSAGSTIFQVQDMESAGCPQPQVKVASPTTSAASKGEQKPTSAKQEGLKIANEPFDASVESMSVKEPASQLVEEEVQQRVASGEAGKKKKKKKVGPPANDLQWKTPQDFQTGNYNYNPYWNGMHPEAGMDGFMGPYYAGAMPYMGGYGYGYGYGYGGVNVMPPESDPFGAQYMFPQMMGGDHCHEIPRQRSDRTTPEQSLRDHQVPPRPAKRKADQHHDRDHHHHHHKPSSNGYYDDYKTSGGGGGRKSSSSSNAVDYESSDDDRHFKRRKPSRYESSPPPSAEWEEKARRHSRGSRERERSSYSQHRY
ncbi:Zinc finger, RING/FYVE/PHD-type [Corchorus capsularis]|uniref:Zinc finger, RING/FYVE/PHD-type n=1 Tax=Corchorus capsularis TaxID=210143 RepID=A0A1R3IBD0_COCAP|nr:Zinc finger, RING/FYVE/PHD-type [Corchorus capsularis]